MEIAERRFMGKNIARTLVSRQVTMDAFTQSAIS